MTKRILKKWRHIKGYEGLYEVSDYGTFLLRKTFERLNTELQESTGLQIVTLRKNSVNKVYYVHELVAQHFIPNPNKYQHVIHINRILTMNHVSNLKWATEEEKAKFDELNCKYPVTSLNVSTPCQDFVTGIIYKSLRQACTMTGEDYKEAIHKIKFKQRESRFMYVKRK